MTGSEFDKDFGYLMPFLDKVTAAASQISDPAAREEFARLVSGEKERWLRVRELLSGADEQESDISDREAQEPQTIAEEAITEEQELRVRGQRSDEPRTVVEKAVIREDEESQSSSPVDSDANFKSALKFTVGSLRPGNR